MLKVGVKTQLAAWERSDFSSVISMKAGLGLSLREQVQLCSRLPAHRLRLGLCPAVCRLAAGRLGEVRTRALRHRLLYRLAPVQSAQHSALLHRGALHLLLHPALLYHGRVLLQHSDEGAFFTQAHGAALVKAGAHDQHPDDYSEGERGKSAVFTWILRYFFDTIRSLNPV